MRRPGQPGQGGDRAAQFFAHMDRDGDGQISKEEAPERLKERFDAVDTNRDGVLDKPELEVLAKRMRERSQQPDQKRRSNMYQKDGKTSGGAAPKRPAPIE
jgi:Ca2+-binding EF-hand superfamily protein